MILVPRRALPMLAAVSVVAACAPMPEPEFVPPPGTEVIVEDEPAWRAIAGNADQDRIERVGEAWDRAIAQIGPRRLRRLLQEEGPLLDPDVALARPAPPPGPYRCRVLKLGHQRPRGQAFVGYPSYFCYVDADGDVLTLVKQTGSERPAGRIYPDSDETREIFLGTLVLGNENEPLPYGEEAERDMAGVVERVGPFRYRLVLPFPLRDSLVDVMELVPVIE